MNWIHWSFEADWIYDSIENSHSDTVHGRIYKLWRFYLWDRTDIRIAWAMTHEYLPKPRWTTSLMYSENNRSVTSIADRSVSIASVSQEYGARWAMMAVCIPVSCGDKIWQPFSQYLQSEFLLGNLTLYTHCRSPDSIHINPTKREGTWDAVIITPHAAPSLLTPYGTKGVWFKNSLNQYTLNPRARNAAAVNFMNLSELCRWSRPNTTPLDCAFLTFRRT